MLNQNGLLLDEAGVVRGLEVPITDCRVSGLPRIAKHHQLRINDNMQMEQEIRIITLTADGSQPVRSSIAMLYPGADTDEAVRRSMNQELDRWKEKTCTFVTAGAYVDPATGGFVSPDTEGAVEQLQVFQSLTPAKLRASGMPIEKNGSTPVPAMVYMILLAEIQKQDALGRL